jgi:tetratricopeptide (TPR) repeat protein
MGVLATLAGGLLLLAVSAAALRMRKRPYLAVGWFWYVARLIPVIGLIQAGQQAHADRYTYLPLIGIFLALSWGLGDVLERFVRNRRWGTQVVVVAVIALISCCALIAREQVGYWRNSLTLYEHATLAVQGNFQMHYNLALRLKNAGEVERSIEEYRKAIEINPRMTRAHYNLGNTYFRLDRFDEAFEHFEYAANDPSMRNLAL